MTRQELARRQPRQNPREGEMGRGVSPLLAEKSIIADVPPEEADYLRQPTVNLSFNLKWVDQYADRTRRTAALVDQLHAVVEELEKLHPGRKFPLDGHLVGSLGEAAGEALFDVTLRPLSNRGYDAVAADGRTVEIKATYGNGAVAIRPTSHDHADSLIVLRLSRRPGEDHEEVYNGPFAEAAAIAGPPGSNGQAQMRLTKLRALNAVVDESDRIPRRRMPNGMEPGRTL